MSAARHDDEELAGRVLDGAPATDGDEAAARAPYEKLAARLGSLPPLEPPAGWEDRLAARRAADLRRARNRRIVWFAVPLALAAAVVAWWWLRPKTTRVASGAPTLAMNVVHGGSVMRGTSAAVGDILEATATVTAPDAEVRVYRDDQTVVMRCPDAAAARDACAVERDGARWTITVRYPPPRTGAYRMVLIAGAHPIPSASLGLDADISAFEASGLVHRTSDPIDVQ